jgi:pilus assembly protein CpaB
MDRRFLTVLGVSLVFALVVSSIFYQLSSGTGPAAPVESEMQDIVVAAKVIPLGVAIKPDDIKVIKVPAAAFPKGAFSKPEEVIDRPVISNILIEEPIVDGRLGLRGQSFLGASIPLGMRAVAVRVNDVAGVAGFVLPGMKVDVLVTGRPPNSDNENSVTRTVLQNITVLTAGTSVQADPRGQAINAPVVTLLVTPAQAEILTLAGSEAKVQLVLRSGADPTVSSTPGHRLTDIYRTGAGDRRPANPDWSDTGGRRTQPIAVAKPVPPPPPPVAAPPAAVADSIVVIRGNTRSVEMVGFGQKPQN